MDPAAMEAFIREVAGAKTWQEQVEEELDREGVTDPEEREEAIHAAQTTLDDLIRCQEEREALIAKARAVLGEGPGA